MSWKVISEKTQNKKEKLVNHQCRKMANPKNLRNNNLKSLFKWSISTFKKHSRVMKIMQKEKYVSSNKKS